MVLSFKKMQSLGNDFVVLIDPQMLTQKQITQICDRRRGVGCDQLIICTDFLPQEQAADNIAALKMAIFNQDGSHAGACGNATRCVAAHFMKENNLDQINIQTKAGILHCKWAARNQKMVSVNMGRPTLDWRSIPLAHEVDTVNMPAIGAGYGGAVAVNMGNPHAVFFVDDCETIPIETIGRDLEFDPIFPERANIEFATLRADGSIRMRVWERGAGITQACGSGACATLVAAICKGLAVKDNQALIQMDGGVLHIMWQGDERDGVIMTGDYHEVFDGSMSL